MKENEKGSVYEAQLLDALKKVKPNRHYKSYHSHLDEAESIVCEYTVWTMDCSDTFIAVYEDGLCLARFYDNDTELRPDPEHPGYVAAIEKLKEQYPELKIRIDEYHMVEMEISFYLEDCQPLDEKIAAINKMFRSAHIEIYLALKKRLSLYKDIITEISPKLNLECYPDAGRCIYSNESEDIYVQFECYEPWPGQLAIEWNSGEWFSVDDIDLLGELIDEILSVKYPQLNFSCWRMITSCEEWKTIISSKIILEVDTDPLKAKPIINEAMETLVPQLVEAVTLLRKFHNQIEELPEYLETVKMDKTE